MGIPRAAPMCSRARSAAPLRRSPRAGIAAELGLRMRSLGARNWLGPGGASGRMGDVAKIELPASWASAAQPLRSLMAELEREAPASAATLADLLAVSARWARASTLEARVP